MLCSNDFVHESNEPFLLRDNTVTLQHTMALEPELTFHSVSPFPKICDIGEITQPLLFLLANKKYNNQDKVTSDSSKICILCANMPEAIILCSLNTYAAIQLAQDKSDTEMLSN